MRPHVERVSNASYEALQALGEGDRVAIMAFDRASRMHLPFRQSHAEIQGGLEKLLHDENFNGGTDITRALLDAAEYVRANARKDARRAIVILTDDQTERSRDESAVGRALVRADAVLSLLLAPDAMGFSRMPGTSWPGGMGGGPWGGVVLGRRRPPVTIGRTRSAGTAEIARASGGDSIPVDDARALENTISRLRQRYALHFNLPADAKPGQERPIEVSLSDAALRRYPGATVRYRRVYLAPGSQGDAPLAPEPVVISQAPEPSAAPPVEERRHDRQRRRRTAESPRRDGPLDVEPDGGWKPVAPQTKDAPAEPAEPEQQGGGWRRVDEQPGGWRRVSPGQKP
jgi:hypothetical protein